MNELVLLTIANSSPHKQSSKTVVGTGGVGGGGGGGVGSDGLNCTASARFKHCAE